MSQGEPQPANLPAPATADTATTEARPPQIDLERFRELDLRVAEIVAAEPIPGATRLLRLEVDLGTERRQLVAGIAEFFQPVQLLGRKIIVVANLKPARLRGVESQGMLLAAGGQAPGEPLGLLTVDPPVPNGTRVS
ncbi:MAG: methionine--tRNA ligase subunit beta [Chloroflexi bacterium]|nr:methionine--tRNA ligase subunit beta [Chloroflexota bacterium]